jgi:hypothetical protein
MCIYSKYVLYLIIIHRTAVNSICGMVYHIYIPMAIYILKYIFDSDIWIFYLLTNLRTLHPSVLFIGIIVLSMLHGSLFSRYY